MTKVHNIKPRRNASHPLPLFAWADRRAVVPLCPTERVIARRYGLSPIWARLVCREAGLGGSSHD